MELALEAGAEGFSGRRCREDATEPGQFEAVHRRIEAGTSNAPRRKVTSLPLALARLGARSSRAWRAWIESLEEHDDVKEVYANAEFGGERLEPGAGDSADAMVATPDCPFSD